MELQGSGAAKDRESSDPTAKSKQIDAHRIPKSKAKKSLASLIYEDTSEEEYNLDDLETTEDLDDSKVKGGTDSILEDSS